jgi:ribosomal protein S18 acetylase RimI-like enzyme
VPSLTIRHALPDDYEPLGELVVAAYEALYVGIDLGEYADTLRAVQRRAEEAVVLAAVDAVADGGADALLGCVTYVRDESSPWAEQLEAGEAMIRILAVAPGAQRRGVGEALTRACIERARADRRTGVFLHSTPVMKVAHRLYTRLGFVRAPERDWSAGPEIPLLAFHLSL